MKLKTQTSFQLVLLKHRNFNGIRLFFWPRKISSILQKVFNTISNKSKKDEERRTHHPKNSPQPVQEAPRNPNQRKRLLYRVQEPSKVRQVRQEKVPASRKFPGLPRPSHIWDARPQRQVVSTQRSPEPVDAVAQLEGQKVDESKWPLCFVTLLQVACDVKTVWLFEC